MSNVKCYNCHKYGHIATNCWRRMYRSNKQRLQQYQQPRRLTYKYNCDFYGYFYSCHLFGHKTINCEYNQWRIGTFHARFRSAMRTKIFHLLGHVEYYTFHNFGHMARDCLLPRYSSQKRQKKKKKRGPNIKPLKEGKKKVKEAKKKPKTMWTKKEQQLARCGIEIFSHDEDDMRMLIVDAHTVC